MEARGAVDESNGLPGRDARPAASVEREQMDAMPPNGSGSGPGIQEENPEGGGLSLSAAGGSGVAAQVRTPTI